MTTLQETCSFLKKSDIEHKKCINAYQCRFSKCVQEVNNYNASILTPADTSACFDKKIKDYGKCIEDKMKAKGTTEKLNELDKCVSSNCPHEQDYREYLQKQMASHIGNSMSYLKQNKKSKKLKKTNTKKSNTKKSNTKKNKQIRNTRTKSK